jgi:hypothetical protein
MLSMPALARLAASKALTAKKGPGTSDPDMAGNTLAEVSLSGSDDAQGDPGFG